ncbi:MAG: DUF2157 domain-containing protein [Hydrogenophaga sp.]|uniref:DUF2157 domain-containing protein n=1 Tax=Hydrogenophaga sp. TaxID=1904254 RepID=UPI00272F7755|nr:DUF2157 domain-containing protein [Hydrogenophaga sp.]MDP2163744.1 DUF2157 domain-containing protein [Hydrogenophaga sp.]MDP3475910.1 DUF2157 domain-containing protein [Hydrogenophaga sp.]
MNKNDPDSRPVAGSPPGAAAQADEVFLPSVRVQLGWHDMDAAVQSGILAPTEAHALWSAWARPGSHTRWEPGGLSVPGAALERTASERVPVASGPRFSFTNTLYYFGGMLAIGAMTLFMTLGWELFGAWGVLALALGYLVGALLVAGNLLKKGLHTPAGILATLAVCLVPLAVWALQKGLGAWPEGGADSYRDYHRFIHWRWVTLELATLAAAVVMLWRYKLPFMVMPVAVTLWYMSMDVARFLMQTSGFDWQFRLDVSLVFGLFTCAVAVWVDLRTRRATLPEDRQDFAFWLYLFGAIMFWAGLSMQNSDSEVNKFIYALINVGLVFLGAAIGRRVFTVLGALGVAGYLGYLSYRVFEDSLLFPFALTLLGLAVVGLGIWWQKHEASLHARLASWLPAALRPLAQG